MTKRSRNLLGLPVISLDDGLKLGHVRGLVVDPPNKALAAVIVESGGLIREQRFIPLTKIHSMRFDAVTVKKNAGAEKGTALPHIVQLWKDRITLTGSRVISENGTVLGRVQDYTVNVENGRIEGIELADSSLNRVLKGNSFIPANLVRTIAKETIVVADQAVASMEQLGGGLEERLRRVLSIGKTRFGGNKPKGGNESD